MIGDLIFNITISGDVSTSPNKKTTKEDGI